MAGEDVEVCSLHLGVKLRLQVKASTSGPQVPFGAPTVVWPRPAGDEEEQLEVLPLSAF